MRKLALSSLLHERGKLTAALVGIAFAAALVLVQSGLYYGFQQSATNVISNVGGDVWVMAKGTALLDFADPISESARDTASSHACVAHTRGLMMTWASLRKPSGATENIQLIGFQPNDAADHRSGSMPWTLQAGLASDLHAPLRVAVDALDLDRLELPDDAVGHALQINDRTTYVAAITGGIRPFTVVPYVFAELRNAQRIMGLSGAYSFLVIDLKDASCAKDVLAFVNARPDLDGHTREEFAQMTAEYWLTRSGAGGTLQFTAILALAVGLVVVAQVLYALTESRLRELATLKAMGASAAALLGYVAWQAGFLAGGGAVLGTLLALVIRRAVESAGLVVVLSPRVMLIGLGAIALMCVVASFASGRRIIRIPAAEVFR